MNKKLIIGAIVGLLVIGGGLAFLFGRSGEDTNSKTSTVSTKTDGPLKQYDACSLLTLAEAKEILGTSATEGANTPAVSGGDVKVSNCSYTNGATAVKDIRVITVTARAPLTQSGVESNKVLFDEQRPKGGQTIDRYGQDAVWDPATHQLTISRDNNWIAIVYGGTNPANNTLEDAKLVADKVLKD